MEGEKIQPAILTIKENGAGYFAATGGAVEGMSFTIWMRVILGHPKTVSRFLLKKYQDK